VLKVERLCSIKVEYIYFEIEDNNGKGFN